MRITLDEALSMRLTAAIDEGWLQLVVPEQSNYSSVGVDDLVVVVKTAFADVFGHILASGLAALLVELFKAQAEGHDDVTLEREVRDALSEALKLTRYVDESVIA